MASETSLAKNMNGTCPHVQGVYSVLGGKTCLPDVGNQEGIFHQTFVNMFTQQNRLCWTDKGFDLKCN